MRTSKQVSQPSTSSVPACSGSLGWHKRKLRSCNRYYLRIIVVLFLAIYAAYSAAATLTGRAVRIIDSDTIVVLGGGNLQHKIRLIFELVAHGITANPLANLMG